MTFNYIVHKKIYHQHCQRERWENVANTIYSEMAWDSGPGEIIIIQGRDVWLRTDQQELS